MTKKSKTEILPEKKTKAPATRKLTKKERDEYHRQMNEAWSKVRESIVAGRIQAPWWRQEE